MKKLLLTTLILTLMSMLLGGCASTKLSDAFDKATVETTAKQVVDYLNASDYDSVCVMLRDDLKEQLTAEDLQSAVDKTYGDAGAFVEYKNVAIIGQKVQTTKEDAAVAILVAKYENKKVTFTLSFDTDMKMIGIYMK